MEMPFAITDALRGLKEAQIGQMIFVPSTGKAKTPSMSIHGAAFAIGGSGWIKVRAAEGGFNVWKKAEPNSKTQGRHAQS